MDKQTFKELERGDIVKRKGGSTSYVVNANYGNRVTAVNTVDMTNPDEWELVLKASYKKLCR